MTGRLAISRKAIFLVFLLYLALAQASARERPHYLFVLPDGYVGWIQIIFNDPQAPPPILHYTEAQIRTVCMAGATLQAGGTSPGVLGAGTASSGASEDTLEKTMIVPGSKAVSVDKLQQNLTFL
jgi:hypothetical protein